ncbi:class I SAM-dependent RNA methyltransferase [Candidatus Saccharibacteria bacterium]|nr:class I SAM-dependent RNA methyltransferase [Candidatus Saccharibacteria bacterium]
MEEIFVDKIIPGGQALGTMRDGCKIFFWNALPGETVTQYEITKKKSHYVEAVAIKIKNDSLHRVEPSDTCFLATSPWQMVDFKYEQQLKGELVQEVFRQNQIEIEAPEVVTDGKEYGYRNKMEYSLFYDFGDEKIHLAFHQRGSHRKMPIKKSSIERPEIFAYAQGVVDDLNARGEEARKYQSLLLRCNQAGEVSGGLFENHQPHPVFKNLKDTILGHEYSYSPNGFFQINLPVYEMALTEIKKHVEPGRVLDLYSGVGTIGLSVAEDAILVESNKAAYMEAIENIKGTGAKAVLAKSEEVLDYIEPDMTVIVDPPRAGCDVKLIEKLLEVKPKKIIYLSCNPATQARDVKMLLDGYKIEAMKTFNFFPRTPHIENLVILSK